MHVSVQLSIPNLRAHKALNPYIIQVDRQSGLDCRYQVADGADLSAWKAASFDAVMSCLGIFFCTPWEQCALPCCMLTL